MVEGMVFSGHTGSYTAAAAYTLSLLTTALLQ